MILNTDIGLKPFERVEDLQCVSGGGYYIIQSENKYKFTSDAVALANFAARRIRGGKRVIDLCSGSGVIPLLLCAKTSASVTAVELDGELFDMAVRSVVLNGLGSRVRLVHADILEYKDEPFDAVTVNPPYFKLGSGLIREVDKGACAEINVTLSGVVGACSRLVNFGGSVFMVHRADRLADIITEMRAVSLEVKELLFLRGGGVILRAVRGGKCGLKILNEFKEGDDALYCSYTNR